MRLLLTFLLTLLSLCLSAQQMTVTGKIVFKGDHATKYVEVKSPSAFPVSTMMDEDGMFLLYFNEKKVVDIFIKIPELDTTIVRTADLTNGLNQDLGKIKINVQFQGPVRVVGITDDPYKPTKLDKFDIALLPFDQVPQVLKYTTAARSNNELTNNYNVQGGSFDENLVYVNGFNIYRPFLTRTGQQEGMSFINTAMVESIKFSAGGFNAEYGDKLSSVLDITYKNPGYFEEKSGVHGSVKASILGMEAHVEHKANARFNYLAGARYRSNGYFLNTLPTKGAYNPVFMDGQILTNFAITEKLNWSVIGHYSSNNYRFIPQTQQTDFGTANEAYSFTIYFEGQEQTVFRTLTGGTSLNWVDDAVRPKTHLDLYATVFNTDEKEYFDVLGQYFINELETDPSKEEFGDSIAVLGIGSFLNHARNRLNATIINIYHHGDHELYKRLASDSLRFQKHVLKWGANFQVDQFTDELSEWKMIDSAGYSIPQEPSGEIQLFETIKGNLSLNAQRYTSFFQLNSLWYRNKKNKVVSISKSYKEEGEKKFRTFTDTILASPTRWRLSLGGRAVYTSSNDEFFFTPRATVKFYPRSYMVKNDTIVRRNNNFKFATGLYYQPPFYREFRTFTGDLNLNVKAQKSFHAVAGSEFFFQMWNRDVPFKLTTEAFYKYMWDVNPYEVENVRTRYYAENNAKAYAYGVDVILNGEFIEGVQSFFKIGMLSTKEDILDDYYYDYYNEAGEKIIFGFSEDQDVQDSVRVEPGFIPRPTDQLLTISALVQDRMPTIESFSVQMGMYFGSSLPYGPPGTDRYKDTLRIKSYFRVDIGFSYDFLYKRKEREKKNEKEEKKANFFTKNFTDAVLSFEVFNLLGVNNVMSKQWVQDVSGKYYSIPNYLTQRTFNLKMILRF
jgi:hypothetical protein